MWIVNGIGLTNLYENYAKTLTESTFSFSITAEEIRAGKGNALFGKYFHDSNLNVTLTDAMFNMNYIAASLGVNVEQGGLCMYESTSTPATVTTANQIPLPAGYTPVATKGSLIGWYAVSGTDSWSVGNIAGSAGSYYMSVNGAQVGAQYCVKFFYIDANAQSITIPTQYVPAELHVVLINDLYNGDVNSDANVSVIGKLVTDIPRLQMDGAQDLNLSASGAATVSLSGSALAVESSTGCETESYYGTMTEIIDGAVWQDNVKALAAVNSEISLSVAGTATETAIIYGVFGNGIASKMLDNTSLTFTPANAKVTVTTAGVISKGTGAQSGDVVDIEVNLTNHASVPSAFIQVTFTA